MSWFTWKKAGIFAGGVLFGSAGLKVLAGRDAKRVYTYCVAAGLRAKDSAMDAVTNIQENFEDIVEEAKLINEERELEEEFWDDFDEFDDEDFRDDEECDCSEYDGEEAVDKK